MKDCFTACASLEQSLQREPGFSPTAESSIAVTHSVGSEEEGKCNLPVSQCLVHSTRQIYLFIVYTRPQFIEMAYQ